MIFFDTRRDEMDPLDLTRVGESVEFMVSQYTNATMGFAARDSGGWGTSGGTVQIQASIDGDNWEQLPGTSSVASDDILQGLDVTDYRFVRATVTAVGVSAGLVDVSAFFSEGRRPVTVTNKATNPAYVTFDQTRADAFGRFRVSDPDTLFDSKQIIDNQPLLWDESLVSGAGITAAWSADRSDTIITSTATTAGNFVRQTFRRFNYQPGKSQLVLMTGVLTKTGGGTGVETCMGYYDDDNGLFLTDNEGTLQFVRRTSTSGSAVDNAVSQSDWSGDPCDGTGPSGFSFDKTKANILWIDFEALLVGRVRMGFVTGAGEFVLAHEFQNANALDVAYMTTPNLPLRYEIITTASSPATTMACICSTVISEGGAEPTGVVRYDSTAGTHVDANTENTIYALVGIRLKSGALDASIELLSVSIAEHQGNNNYEWLLIVNPTVAGTFTYSDVTNAAVQTAKGATANTVTNGTVIAGGHASSALKGSSDQKSLDSAQRLGAAIDGTVDEIVLCARPIGGSINLDLEAGITWRELQ